MNIINKILIILILSLNLNSVSFADEHENKELLDEELPATNPFAGSAGNISSIKEINSLIKYYKSQMNVDKVNKLRYETFIASLIAMKSREIKEL